MINFNTYDYEFLTKFLTEGSTAFKAESLKRLTSLAQNDKKQFLTNSKMILNSIEELYYEQKDDINILNTFLLSQIILNVISKQNQQSVKSKHLKHVIHNLGHTSKPSIRKASHTCLLAFVKTYHSFDGVLSEYLDAGFQNQSTLVRQKSINSFQSIFMIQARYFNWKSEQAKRLLQTMTLKVSDDNIQIVKAASQCLLSLLRAEGVKITLSMLSIGFLQKLKDFYMSTVLKLPNQESYITLEDINQIIEGQRRKPKQPQVPIQIEKKQPKIDQSTSQVHQRRVEKIKKSIDYEQKKQQKEQNINLNKFFNNINSQGSLKERTEAAEDLLFKIQSNKNKPEFSASIKTILPNIIKMMRDPNPKIVSITLRILECILDELKPSEKQLTNLILVVIEKLGDQKISIRQMVAKVIKQLIKKTQKGIWIRELLQYMRKNTNTFLKDQTLGIIFNIYDENEIENVNFPVEELLQKIVVFTDDPKTKIKIKTVDCLSQIVFKSGQIQKYNELLRNSMPEVIYQMYQKRVNNLVQEKEKRQALQAERKQKRQEISHYRSTFQDKMRSKKDQEDEKLNVSMDVVKKRVSQLRKHRLQSTQETSSLNNTQRTIDRNLQDVEIMLPSLYKKTKSNRFELKKKFEHSSPQKNDNKNSDYLAKEDLKPVSDPEKELKFILSDLKNSDWKVQFQSTNTLRRIIQFNRNVISSTSNTNLHVIVLDLLNLIESLRSSVSKNALICLNQLVMALGKQIDPEVEIILEKLMKKSADTNIFISSEVQKCLKAISLYASPLKVLDKLSIYKDSKNLPIKDSFINILLVMKSDERIRSREYAKLADIMAGFLSEGQQELRTKAKSGLIDICKSLGDWYRMLRGKISSSSFKLICDLMSKANSQNEPMTPINRKTKPFTSQFKTINVDTRIVERIEGSRGESKMSNKKAYTKVSQFPEQFNQIQKYIDMSSSSQWKKRMQATQNLKKLAIQFPNQFVQYRSSCHFIDILSKQVVQPNVKVSLSAMQIFLELKGPLRTLVDNSMGTISHNIFNCLSSNKTEVKEMAEKCTSTLIDNSEIQQILPHLCHGIQYALPKSRIALVNKLQMLIEPIFNERKQLLYKYVFPVLNKLMDEYRAELMPHVVNLFVHMYDILGNNMFSHITKFKEVRELIAK